MASTSTPLGESVVLTGALAEAVSQRLDDDHHHKADDLRQVFGAYVGMPVEELTKVEIELPANLLEWVTEEAANGQGQTPGQFISDILEAERYRETRIFCSTGWKAIGRRGQAQVKRT